MFSTRSVIRCFAAAILLAGAQTALGLPADRIVISRLRETPSDENSPVRMTITLHISAVAQYENAIGWQVTQVDIVQPGQAGGDDAVWRDDWPSLNAPGELWWVEHSDPESPANSEFANQPEVFGTAAPVVNAPEGLVYSLAAMESSSNQFDGNVRDAAYSLALESNPEEPIEEDPEEPVETDGTIDPS